MKKFYRGSYIYASCQVWFPNLAVSIYVRSSIKFLHFVPFHQQIWPPRAILVSDWLLFKKIFSSETRTRDSAHWASFAHLTIEWYWNKFQREIIITFKNSSHLEWRVGLSDTILKGTHPGTKINRFTFLKILIKWSPKEENGSSTLLFFKKWASYRLYRKWPPRIENQTVPKIIAISRGGTY
jgi:hypothetical protein